MHSILAEEKKFKMIFTQLLMPGFELVVINYESLHKIKQTGWDGGILGILRKRFDGVPHYLVEAKCEPGNPNMVQISP